MSNLEHLLLSMSSQAPKDELAHNEKSNGHFKNNVEHFNKHVESKKGETIPSVQLTGIKNLGFVEDNSLPDFLRKV